MSKPQSIEPIHGPMQNITALLLCRKECQTDREDCPEVASSTWLEDAMFLSIVLLVCVALLREFRSFSDVLQRVAEPNNYSDRWLHMIYLTAA
jgi:hypothetical protein